MPGEIDAETVKVLLETSDDDARARYYATLTQPAYDELPRWVKALEPRDRIGRCLWCGGRFPKLAGSGGHHHGGGRVFCKTTCRVNASDARLYERDPLARSRRAVKRLDRQNARKRAMGLRKPPTRAYRSKHREALAAAAG
jgi:hypothetical protein